MGAAMLPEDNFKTKHLASAGRVLQAPGEHITLRLSQPEHMDKAPGHSVKRQPQEVVKERVGL
jgi:hypothetical protein